MNRAIVGFHQDGVGDWVAELACGHSQHIRHRPPFELREWVLSEDERAAAVGTLRDCPLCNRGGEPACFAHLVCAECGSVVGDGAGHRAGCSLSGA
jgi:hypothetical protein